MKDSWTCHISANCWHSNADVIHMLLNLGGNGLQCIRKLLSNGEPQRFYIGATTGYYELLKRVWVTSQQTSVYCFGLQQEF